MSIYEEVEIEDLDFDSEKLEYSYPCPCGDRFRISLEDLWDGEDIALCPSCTLRIMIIYDEDDLPELPEGYDDSDSENDDDHDNGEEKKVDEDTNESSNKDRSGNDGALSKGIVNLSIK